VRRRARTFIVDWHIYPFDVLVSTDTYESVIRRLEKAGIDLNDSDRKCLQMTGPGRTIRLRDGQTVLRLKDPPNNPQRIAMLVHEVHHAVSSLFDHLGIRLTLDSDEAYAYAVQYLTEKILLGFK
jgi:hypothetical protein